MGQISSSTAPDNKSIRGTLDAVLSQNEILKRQVALQESQMKNANRNSSLGLIIAFTALLSSIGILLFNFSNYKTNSIESGVNRIINVIEKESNSIRSELKNKDINTTQVSEEKIVDFPKVLEGVTAK